MKQPVAKISNHSRRLATFASDVIDHSRRLAKVANLRFALLRVQSKRTFTLTCFVRCTTSSVFHAIYILHSYTLNPHQPQRKCASVLDVQKQFIEIIGFNYGFLDPNILLQIQKVCNKFNNMFDRHILSKKATKTHKALATSNNNKFLTLDQCLIKNSASFMYNYHKKSLPKIFRNRFLYYQEQKCGNKKQFKNFSRLLHLHSKQTIRKILGP